MKLRLYLSYRFSVVGHGCMTCIGNSGPLDPAVAATIEQGDLVVAGVLSGNRNFEGRIHPHTRANYLASPPLVVAFALAGTVVIDFDKEPIGHSPDGSAVFLRDIWPSRSEVDQLERAVVRPAMFEDVYSHVEVNALCFPSVLSFLFIGLGRFGNGIFSFILRVEIAGGMLWKCTSRSCTRGTSIRRT